MKIQFKATVPLDADIIEIWDDVKGIHKTTLGGSGEGYIVYFVGNLNDGLNAISLLCNYEGVTLRAEVYK